jgi:hypothetical protein
MTLLTGSHRGVLAAVLAAVLLAACAELPVSRTYISDSTHGVSLVAPADWEVLESSQILAAGVPGPPYLVGFGRDVANPTEPMIGPSPGGVMTVTLHPGLDAARAAAVNAFLTDLAAAAAAGSARILDESETVVVGEFERRRWILEITAPDGTVARVLQEVATSTRPVARSSDGAELHANKALILGCHVECFAENRNLIFDVYKSWEVL